MHEGDEPDAVVDFIDADCLAGQHMGDVDLCANVVKLTREVSTTVLLSWLI